jgi:phosphoglycolate phosphatase
MKILDRNIKLTKPISILFDWDNTIVDSLDIVFASAVETFKAFNLEPLSREEFMESTHVSSKIFIKKYFSEAHHVKARELFLELYAQLSAEKGDLMLLPDAKEALELLHNKKIKMAIVSNKSKALLSKELESTGLADYFLSVVGSGDLEEDKPSPLPALKALQDINIEPSQEVWFIGDSSTDMGTAHNANCLPVFFGTDDYESEPYKQCRPKVHALNHKALIKYFSSLDD